MSNDTDGADMCDNCVTPWKCNGPHVVSVSAEQYERLTGPDHAAEVPQALREIVLSQRAHEPGEDWTCSCGYDYFGGSAAYSWQLYEAHLADSGFVTLTEDEAMAAARSTLARVGYTYSELETQAEAHRFDHVGAQLAWMAVRHIGDPGEWKP